MGLTKIFMLTGKNCVSMATRMAARYISRRLSSSGKVLSEEEKAAENIYIKVNFFLGITYLDVGLASIFSSGCFSWQVAFSSSFSALLSRN